MQTIGERLEEARKRKGISLREASESTKIRSDYLQKFETNSYELNLPDIYVRGFLRTYGHYLKLNTEKLLTDYASLGLGEPRPPREARRQDQRESFGRIDLADAGKPSTSPAPGNHAAARNQPAQTRSVPTAVVTGAPSADRRQKFKASFLVGGAALALVLLIIVLRAILPSSSDSRPATTPASSAANSGPRDNPASVPAENLMLLKALDNVRVKVTQQSDNKVLFDGDLRKGETRALEKTGKVYITFDIGKNLQVEIRGQPFRMSIDGYGRNTLE